MYPSIVSNRGDDYNTVCSRVAEWRERLTTTTRLNNGKRPKRVTSLSRKCVCWSARRGGGSHMRALLSLKTPS